MNPIICAIWGIEKSGKSSLALTFPKPLKHYDLDVGGFERASWRIKPEELLQIKSTSYPIPVQMEKLMGAQKQGATIRFSRKVIGYKEVWQQIVQDFVADCQSKEVRTIVIDSATQLWSICLAPDTRILYTDLTWRKLGNVKVGDSLVGFSEYAELIGDRVLKETRVKAVSSRVSSAYRIWLDNGLSVVASPEHPWLTVSIKREWDVNRIYSERGFLPKERWTKTNCLNIGDRIRFICQPWETDNSYEAGYLAGLYDSEGCIDSPKALTLTQKSYIVNQRLLEILCAKGFEPKVYRHSSDTFTTRIQKKREILRFLGSIRPLLPNKNKIWEYSVIQGDRNTATIIGIEQTTDTELIDIQTSTGTFIAEGLFTHNCHTSLLQEKQEIQLATSPGMKADSPDFRERLQPVEFPNDRIRSLIYTARSYRKNLVLTHYPTSVYKQRFSSTTGKVESYESDELRPDGFKDTVKLVDIVLWTYTEVEKVKGKADTIVPRVKINPVCGIPGLGMTAVGLELPEPSYKGLLDLQSAMQGE